jgi:hypothetical protein
MIFMIHYHCILLQCLLLLRFLCFRVGDGLCRLVVVGDVVGWGFVHCSVAIIIVTVMPVAVGRRVTVTPWMVFCDVCS